MSKRRKRERELIDAIVMKDVATVRALIASGTSIDTMDNNPATAKAR